MPAAPAGEEKPVAAFTLAAAPQSVAINANGSRVSAGVVEPAGNMTRVFDVAAGKEILTLAEHARPIVSLIVSPDNRTLISAGADKASRLCDVPVVAAWDGHAGGASQVSFHSGGTQAISGGADKTVKMWDLTKVGTAPVAPIKAFGPLDAPI